MRPSIGSQSPSLVGRLGICTVHVPRTFCHHRITSWMQPGFPIVQGGNEIMTSVPQGPRANAPES